MKILHFVASNLNAKKEKIAFKTRKRVVLSRPAGLLDCGETAETFPCKRDKSECNHYTWHTTQWSHCFQPEDQVCGSAIRVRGNTPSVF